MYLNWYSENNIWSKGNFGVGSDSASHRLHVHGTGFATSDFRAPIFYDNDNTGYYMDLNNTSYWATSQQNGWHYFNQNYGHGVVGLYASTRFQCVYAMGDAYKGNADGTSLSGAYGLWFSYPSAGGPAASLSSHGLMLIVNGSMYATVDASMRAISDMRSPIFYDYNDTGYYANPNGNSQFNLIFANNWFRSQNDTGWLNETYGRGIWTSDSGSNSYGNVTTYGPGRNGWYGYGIGSRHVFMSTTGDNVGVHDNSRGWIWYWNGSFTSFDFGYTQFAGSARSPLFYDNDNTAFYADLSTTGDSIRAAGNIIAYYSDDRLKTKFGNITNAVDKVRRLNGFYYEANETAQKFGYKPKREVGVSAQELHAVLPEVVTDAPIGHGYLTVDYERIVPLLVEAIKELSAEIEMLKAR
jgi:hypothetical protein